MSLNIKPGMMVQVTSWENDGDFYDTRTFTGLKPSTVPGLLKFLSIFRSSQGRNDVVNIGNKVIDSWSTGLARKALAEVMLENPAFINDLFPDWEYKTKPEDLGEAYSDVETELLGVGEEGERHRVFESLQVFDVPVELKNVTDLYVHNPNLC